MIGRWQVGIAHAQIVNVRARRSRRRPHRIDFGDDIRGKAFDAVKFLGHYRYIPLFFLHRSVGFRAHVRLGLRPQRVYTGLKGLASTMWCIGKETGNGMTDADLEHSHPVPGLDQALPALEQMQHWTRVIGRAQQMILEYSARQMEKADRTEENTTSELQSLMRISYAVFCLKKKKK